MRVTIIGSGRVGLTTAIALHYLGHHVSCVDSDQDLVHTLRNGHFPFHEPTLPYLWHDSDIRISPHLSPASASADVIFIAVPTPTLPDGHADTSAVRSVALQVANTVPDRAHVTLAVKSTVPPGTAHALQLLIDQTLRQGDSSARITTASNPEFLREGSSLADMLYPDRIVLGTPDHHSLFTLLKLYQPIIHQHFSPPQGAPRPPAYSSAPVLATAPINAELIKYAANAFLVTKLSFINELASLAQFLGADITQVAKGIGLDHRIGPHYLSAGAGWGGPCLGKDARALLSIAGDRHLHLSLLSAALSVNSQLPHLIVHTLEQALGSLNHSTIGILGLSFKPDTDDLSESPALQLASLLLSRGVDLRAYDPVAIASTMRQFPHLPIQYYDTVTELATDCDALVLMTAWPEFKHLAWPELAARMKRKTLLDARNFLEHEPIQQAGFTYLAIGRGQSPSAMTAPRAPIGAGSY